MSDNPKLWIGTPGEDDWKDVGEITDFQADAVLDDPVAFEPFDPGAPILPAKNEVTITTKIESSSMDSLLEFAKKYIGSITPEQEQFYRSLMVVGTRPVAHRRPGQRRWNEKRVDHARARRLYSERLRRDRRRKRTGRKPILRTMQIRSLFPRARIEHLERQGNVLGIQAIASQHLDSGTVVMISDSAREIPVHDLEVPVFRDNEAGRAEQAAWRYRMLYGPFSGTARNFLKVDPS